MCKEKPNRTVYSIIVSDYVKKKKIIQIKINIVVVATN